MMRRMLSRTWSATVWAPVVQRSTRTIDMPSRAIVQVDNLLEDGALVLEVEVERPGDACGGDDVLNLRRVVAALREDVPRDGRDLLPRSGLPHARALVQEPRLPREQEVPAEGNRSCEESFLCEYPCAD